MILLDSHVVYWATEDVPRLGPGARREMASRKCYVSALSHAELTLKMLSGKLRFPHDFVARIREHGFEWLPFTEVHSPSLGEFAELGRHDPFDWMLLAQAHAENLDFLTADGRLLALDRDWIVDARA